MNPDAIINLVGALGFPIVCCGALFYQQNKTMKEFTDKMAQETAKLVDATAANTIATNTLVTTVRLLVKEDENGK